MKFKKTVRVKHSAANLFSLVADIESYPTFIRWIQKMDVQPVKSDGMSEERIGKARVGFSRFTENLSTKVLSDRDKKTISVSLVEGPLSHLNNAWSFRSISDQETDVDFDIDFNFKNPILAILAKQNFDRAFGLIMSSFIDEANRRFKTTTY